MRDRLLAQISLDDRRVIYSHWMNLTMITKADFRSVMRTYMPYLMTVIGLVVLLFVLLLLSRQRHRFQLKLAQARALLSAREAEQAQQLARQESHFRQEQADFFAMVVHEVKTPIAMMDGALQSLVLIDACQQPDEVQKRQSRLKRGVDRLNWLVDRFLLKSKLEDRSFKPHYQWLSIGTLVQLWQQQFMGSQHLHILCPQVFNLKADVSLLQLAIANLLENASKYSPPDSSINLTITQQQDQGKDWCYICVIDQGKGIAQDKFEELLQPYVRGKNLGDIVGIGFGLYMTKKIACLHAGYLAAYPNPDAQGSIFCLRFPLQHCGVSTLSRTRIS